MNNASVIFPPDIIKPLFCGSYINDLNEAQIVQWESLPNFLGEQSNSIIPVCDVSGSMICNNYIPISMSISLGLTFQKEMWYYSRMQKLHFQFKLNSPI